MKNVRPNENTVSDTTRHLQPPILTQDYIEDFDFFPGEEELDGANFYSIETGLEKTSRDSILKSPNKQLGIE